MEHTNHPGSSGDASAPYVGKYAVLGEDSWTTVQRQKRQRQSSTPPTSPIVQTVGRPANAEVTVEEFRAMSSDDKLVSLFQQMNNLNSINSRVCNMEKFVSVNWANQEVTDARLKLLEYKSIDHEARLRERNIIISGLPELPNEICFTVTRDFIRDKLQVDMGMVTLTKVFRFGRRHTFRGSQRPRQILATFSDPREVGVVLENTYRLRDTGIGVSRDYPKEIAEARKDLWPEFKGARNRYGKRSVQLRFPAALVVRGEVVRDCFPGWNDILRGSRNINTSERVRAHYEANTDRYKRMINAQIVTPTTNSKSSIKPHDNQEHSSKHPFPSVTSETVSEMEVQSCELPPQVSRPNNNTEIPNNTELSRPATKSMHPDDTKDSQTLSYAPYSYAHSEDGINRPQPESQSDIECGNTLPASGQTTTTRATDKPTTEVEPSSSPPPADTPQH